MSVHTVTRCRHCRGLDVAGLSLDMQRRRIAYEGREVSLIRAEAEILQKLLAAAGMTVRHTALIAAIWGSRADGGPVTALNIVRVRVVRIRGAFRAIAAPFDVVAVWGEGYRLIVSGGVIGEVAP